MSTIGITVSPILGSNVQDVIEECYQLCGKLSLNRVTFSDDERHFSVYADARCLETSNIEKSRPKMWSRTQYKDLYEWTSEEVPDLRKK